RFAHALLRAILYDDMPGSERVAAHRCAAELLSALGGSARHSEIAHHFYRSLPAGEYRRAIAAARRAADAAARVQAFEDAVTYYEWALEAQALDPETNARERADLLFACGSSERLAGRYERARRTLAAVVEIASQHGYGDLLLRSARVLRPTHAVGAIPDRLVRSALEEVLRTSGDRPDPQRISALSQLACVPPYAHDMQRSDELSAEAVDLARKLGDGAALCEALSARLHSLSGPDRVDERLDVARELLEHDGRSPWLKAEAHSARIGAFLYRGDLSAADAALRELELAVHEARFPEAIWFHDRIRNQRRVLDGEFEVARAACKELGARAKRMGLSYGALFTDAQRNSIALAERGIEAARDWNVQALFALGDVLQPSFRAGFVALCAELGHERDARRMFETMSARDFADVPRDIGYLNALAHLARAAVLLADFQRAERLYERLAPYALFNTPNSLLFYEGSASHALAGVAAALGWDERAEAHFETALHQNERFGARPQLARSALEYAQWLARRRGAGRARPVAARAARLASELGMDWVGAAAAPLAG
ncbi:MAG TPA: hypothetical protein VKF60_16735, partial [Myxococcota bacterium]|nr:hypothetical protein [Myxococcota bacterium]